MASKIIVDQLESSGSNITIPTGTGLVVTDGIAATNLSGTIADARLPTVPVAKGGTGLTSLGSANQQVRVNSAGNALEFATISSGGVAQVIQSNLLTKTSTSSTTYTDVGLQAQITPSSSSHKILVFMDASGSSAGNSSGHLRIMRDSTQLRVPSSSGSRIQNMSGGIDNADTPSDGIAGITSIFLDSPNSTSQLTYKVQIRQGGGGSTTYFNRSTADGDGVNTGVAGSSLILMEVTV